MTEREENENDNKFCHVFGDVLSATDKSFSRTDEAHEIVLEKCHKKKRNCKEVKKISSAKKLEPSKTTKKQKETVRDRILKWHSLYSKNFGIWIQCTKCNKWRKVNEYNEDHEVPTNWHCSMSKSSKTTCADPEDGVENADFLPVKFIPGSIVWAKLDGYPWWPGMVELDPDTEEYYWIEVNNRLSYSVTFLCKNVSHAWIPSYYVCSFASAPQQHKNLRERQLRNKYFASLKTAEERANEAMKMTIKERLKRFSFVHLYKGPWPLICDEAEEGKDLNMTEMLIKEMDDVESVKTFDSEENIEMDILQIQKEKEVHSTLFPNKMKRNKSSDNLEKNSTSNLDLQCTSLSDREKKIRVKKSSDVKTLNSCPEKKARKVKNSNQIQLKKNKGESSTNFNDKNIKEIKVMQRNVKDTATKEIKSKISQKPSNKNKEKSQSKVKPIFKKAFAPPLKENFNTSNINLKETETNTKKQVISKNNKSRGDDVIVNNDNGDDSKIHFNDEESTHMIVLPDTSEMNFEGKKNNGKKHTLNIQSNCKTTLHANEQAPKKLKIELSKLPGNCKSVIKKKVTEMHENSETLNSKLTNAFSVNGEDIKEITETINISDTEEKSSGKTVQDEFCFIKDFNEEQSEDEESDPFEA